MELKRNNLSYCRSRAPVAAARGVSIPDGAASEPTATVADLAAVKDHHRDRARPAKRKGEAARGLARAGAQAMTVRGVPMIPPSTYADAEVRGRLRQWKADLSRSYRIVDRL